MSSPALSQRFAFLFGWLADAWRSWRQFWFAPADTAIISLIRLLTGGMLLYNLAVWSIDLEAFFSSQGLQPTAAFAELKAQQWSFSFWWWVSDSWLWHAHIASLVIVFLFFIGAGTRLTSVLAFLITISYSQRVPIANFGLDQILGILCLYLMIAPCGAAFSVDAVLRRRWLSRKQASTTRPAQTAGRILKAPSARLAMRLIQVHLCMIYLWAGLAKLKGTVWWTGEAIWRVVANAEYQTADLTWLAWFPWIPQTLSILTVAWELSFCILIWNRRLRPLVLAIGTAMHLGIGAFLGMWTFGLIMCVAYLSFLPPSWPRDMMSRCNHSIHRLRRIMSANAAAADVTKDSADVVSETSMPVQESANAAASPQDTSCDSESSPVDDFRRPDQPTLNKANSMTESPENKTPFDDEPTDDFLLDALGFDDDADGEETAVAAEPDTTFDSDSEATSDPVDEFELEIEMDDEPEVEFDVMAALAPDDEADDETTADNELPAAAANDEVLEIDDEIEFDDLEFASDTEDPELAEVDLEPNDDIPEVDAEIEFDVELDDGEPIDDEPELVDESEPESEVTETVESEFRDEVEAENPPAAEMAVDVETDAESDDAEAADEESVTEAAAEQAHEPESELPVAASTPADEKGCVLLFASKDKDRASLQSYFESRDFTCFSVSKLSAMVEAVARVDPDVILLLGRKVDGVTLAEAVQELHGLNKAPVAAVVSPEQRGHILTKTMPGSVDLAGYPVTHRDLRFLVSGILSRNSQTDS